MNKSFNFVQQVFALNMFSNLASDKTGSDSILEQDLAAVLGTLLGDPQLQEYIGEWQVVWGPQVGSYGADAKNPNRDVVTNAMYVAYNSMNNQYVVAVSATNPISKYGWFIEDFDVRTMVPWNSILPAGIESPGPDVCVSNGTATGLKNLLQLTDPNTKVPLVTFLQNTFSQSTNPATLVVSGHSLGGAQSSVLGLYLAETLSTWNPAQTVAVSAMPTAGACPGNELFSVYHNNVIGTRTLRFWNKLDPVPHGWEPNMLEQVPFLYYPYLPPGFLLKGIAALALTQSLAGSATCPAGGYYTQLEPQTPPLPGQVGIAATRNITPAEVLELIVDYLAADIFNAINLPPEEAKIIISALNDLIAEALTVLTMDALLALIEAKLATVIGQQMAEQLIQVFNVLFPQLQNVALFLVQLGLQHVSYYPDLMGTATMHPLTQAIINGMTEAGTLSADYTNRIDSLLDPRQSLKMFIKIGQKLPDILTPDVLRQHGMGQFLSTN